MTLRPFTALLLPIALAACVTPSPDVVGTRYHFGWELPAAGAAAAVFDDGGRTYVTLRGSGGTPSFVAADGNLLSFRHVAPYYVIDGVRPVFWIVRNGERTRIALPGRPAPPASAPAASRP